MARKDLAGGKRFSGDYVPMTFYVRATDILERRHVLWESFLRLVIDEKDFTPEMYDPDEEPPRYAFDPADLSEPSRILNTEGEDPLFERYTPHYMFYNINTGSIVAGGPYNWEGISIDVPYFRHRDNVDIFLLFARRLYVLFKPLYGRASHQADRNKQNTVYTYFPEGHPSAGQVYSETGFGGDTTQGIPGVYWANFFSRIYIDTIGRDKFLTAPCYERQELDDGGFLLLTSESPLDWEKPQVQELRKAMRDHLGYEYFCDIENQDRVCKVPPFDFSVWERECDRGMKIPERWKDLPTAKF